MNNEVRLDKERINQIIGKVNFEKLEGLLPVVIQEASSNQILMQAFMDKEALRLTLETGEVHYWSRTRKELWRKGETSGHKQIIKEVYLDCDNDALLLRVQQIGVCCHTGEKTCFHNPIIKVKE